MKVSYVTPFYNGRCDGRFGRFHDWVHALRDMDDPPFEFDVHTIMAANPDETLASTPIGYLGDASELWATKRNKVESVLEAPRIYHDLRQSDADIIHLISFDLLLLPPVVAARGDTPFVLGPNVGGWYPIREDDIWLTGPLEEAKLRTKYFLRKQLVGNLDYSQIIAFSEYHRRMLDLLDVRDADVTTLRPGVNGIFSPEPDFEPPRPPYELLYVGNFSEHKGYPQFLHAVSRLDLEVHARVVGAGDPNQELIRSLGLEDRVTVEGFVDRADLPEFYRSADLYIVPSIDETAGTNTQFEALACGTPVVATDADGINEFAPKDAVVYFWPREPDQLADAITSALENIDSLTEAARAHAPEFQASTPVEQLYSLYQTLI